MAKHSSHILDLAKRGAEVRLRELVDELRLLMATFPGLRDSFDADELPVKFILREGRDKALAGAGGNKGRGWTPAQRKAAAQRMKKSWAARRRAKA